MEGVGGVAKEKGTATFYALESLDFSYKAHVGAVGKTAQ